MTADLDHYAEAQETAQDRTGNYSLYTLRNAMGVPSVPRKAIWAIWFARFDTQYWPTHRSVIEGVASVSFPEVSLWLAVAQGTAQGCTVDCCPYTLRNAIGTPLIPPAWVGLPDCSALPYSWYAVIAVYCFSPGRRIGQR